MPIMDGYQFARKVRNSFSEPKSGVPIILLTAEIAPQEKMKKAGIGSCLLQPFNREELYRLIYEEILWRQISIEQVERL